MPQKVLRDCNAKLEFLPAYHLTSIDKKTHRQIQKGDFEDHVKFFNHFVVECTKLNTNIENGYIEITSRFERLMDEILVAKASRDSSECANASGDSDRDLATTTSPPKASKKDKFEILAQKFKTPIEKRTKDIKFKKDNKPASDTASADTSNEPETKSKKRSALLANLSNVTDDNKDRSIGECDKIGQDQKTNKKLNKKAESGSIVVTKKKKKKITVDHETQILTTTEEPQPGTSSKNPPKKLKLVKSKKDASCIEILDGTLLKEEVESKAQTTKKTSKKVSESSIQNTGTAIKVKKKKKISKIDATEMKTTPSNTTNIAKKLSINNILRNSMVTKKSLLPQYITHNMPTKTPMHNNVISRMQLMQSTLKKSVKPKVLTRAARAAAEAVTNSKQSNGNNLNMQPSTSNAVTSNVKNLASKFNSIATPGQHDRVKPRPSFLQNTAFKLKTTHRNSIDKRKVAAGQGKDTLIKKSVTKEKAMAYLADAHKTAQSQKITTTTTTTRVIVDETMYEETESDMNSSIFSANGIRRSIKFSNDTNANVNSKKEEQMIHDIKARTATVSISKIPSNLLLNNANPTKLNKVINDNQKTIPISSSMSSISKVANTPARQVNQTSLTNLQANLQASIHKSGMKHPLNRLGGPSFMKHCPGPSFKQLDRNTPSKPSSTVQSEKLRADLAAKDKIERDRLADLEKQKNEKRDEHKKQREERLKRAADQKQQKEAEFKSKIESKNVQPCSTNNSTHVVVAPLIKVTGCSSSKLANANESLFSKKQPISSSSNDEGIQEFKKSLLMHKQGYSSNQPLVVDNVLKPHNLNDMKHLKVNNLETTYTLDSPDESDYHQTKPAKNKNLLKASFANYDVTPLQPLRLHNDDNYDVSELKSGDDTDDEEEPSKPLPIWAKEPFLSDKARAQSLKMLNYTKIFKSSSNYEVNLEQIFKNKRKKYTDRSSSAIWDQPPVWDRTNNDCLNTTCEQSFYRIRKGI
jgi:hypothetical protein